MKKKIITASVLGLLAFSATPAFATESIAFSLDVYPTCTGCHVNGNLNTADKGNLMPAAKIAYNQDKRGLSGLKTFLAASTPVVPASPTCTNGQVLNTATNTCVTPVPVCNSPQVLNAAKTACETLAPVVPKCVLPQVLNTAKNVCETPAAVVPTCTGSQVLNAAKTACVASPAPIITPPVTTPVTPPTTTTKNTKPVLNAVAQQWDATVGEPFKIPLSVKDTEQDEFTVLFGILPGAKLSAVKTDGANLPSIDFEWTPLVSQANKIFTITFQAKETKTTPKLVSNKVSVKVRVWAAGSRSSASVKTFAVTTSKFANGSLNLTGKITLNSILTAAERKDFLANKLDLTVSDKTGVLIGTTPLTLDASGNWSATLPTNSSTCDIVLQYEGKNAARSVVGCIKPVAAITKPVTIANNSFDDDDDEESDDHNENKNDKHKHDD
jgi:hypothetical protein